VFWLLAAPCELWKLAFGSWAVVQGERINAFAILRAAFYSPLAMGAEFQFDVFLSHSAKDKPVVRPLAERLRQDGLKVWFDEWVLKPGDSIPAKIEEGLEHSRVLVLCMSANAFGSDWAQLEAGTFRFRDPLNKERRFIPLRLDDAPIKGSLAQFLYIKWLPAAREQEYAKLLLACRPEADARALVAPSRKPGNLGAVIAGMITQKDRIPSGRETLEIDALELCAKLRAVPPLREEEFKQDYRGFWVSWWTTLSSASRHWSDGELCRLQLLPEVPEGYTTPIECSVRMAEYARPDPETKRRVRWEFQAITFIYGHQR
jgi:hypothetical protein